jgi:hypothetical protein
MQGTMILEKVQLVQADDMLSSILLTKMPNNYLLKHPKPTRNLKPYEENHYVPTLLDDKLSLPVLMTEV